MKLLPGCKNRDCPLKRVCGTYEVGKTMKVTPIHKPNPYKVGEVITCDYFIKKI